MAQLLFSLPLVPLETNPCFILFSVSEPLLVGFLVLIALREKFWLKLGALQYCHCIGLSDAHQPSVFLPPTTVQPILLFTVFYKVAMNLELMHSDYLLLGEIQDRILKSPWSHFGKPMCIILFYVFLFVYKHLI